MAELAVTVEALGVAVAAGVPAVLWGPPGTGKTTVVNELAARLGWPCETVIAAIREPSDFAGLPVVGDGEVHFAPPGWGRRLAAAGTGLLFLDEISTAPPAVQAALLRVVLERTVGDLTLPVGVRVVAAANPPEQAADGWDLAAPLANRFCHLDWPADARAVSAGFVGGFEDQDPPRLTESWLDGFPRWRATVGAFLMARPALVCVVPEDASQAGRGWPSPRSWEMVARLLAAAEAAGARPEVVAALIEGAVGAGAGLELQAWLAEADLPDPELVLADPESFVLPDRPDRALAAVSAVAAAVASEPTKERWLAGWVVLGRAANTAPDAAAIAARTLVRCRPTDAPVPPEAGVFAPILRQAGML
jgi:MoxR-like ATPase